VVNRTHWLGLFFLALLLPACVSLQLRAGRRPNPELLESQLTLDQSSEADVMRILGAPLGRGRALLPFHAPRQPDNLLTYYYEEGTLDDSRRIFLFVYVQRGQFDGYMWVSSLPPAKAAEPAAANVR
jgi:hypothetical protein